MAIKIINKNKAQLVVSVGSTSKGTRKRYTKIVEYKGKKDLDRLYRAFEDEVRKNPLNDITIERLLESYIDNAKMRGLSENTLHGYRTCSKRIYSAFKGIKAKDLTTYQIDDFVSSMAKKLAPKTIHNTIHLLDSAYERAVRSGQLAANPCKGITLPKKSRPEIKTLSPEQVHEFFERLEDQPRDIRVGYLLCLMCGLRRGEVLGLHEEDVSTVFRWVSIKRTRYVTEGKEYIKEPKTAQSKRRLALPKLLAEEIDLLIKEHHSKEWHHSSYLIQDAFGDPLSPSVFSNKIRDIMPGITVHGLRHTFATLLNANDVDIAQISAELGHSNLSTTLNIYTHIFGDVASSSRGIADTMDHVFDKKGAEGAHEDNKKAL